MNELVLNVIKNTCTFPQDTDIHSRMDVLDELATNRELVNLVKVIRDWYEATLKDAKFLADELLASRNLNAIKYADMIRQVATGIETPDVTANRTLFAGIDVSFRNWKALGFECPQDAAINFLERSKHYLQST